MKPSIDVGFAALTPADIVFPAFLVCWLVGVATGIFKFKWRPEFWTFVFYFLALLISAIFSVNPSLSFAKLAGASYLILLAVTAPNVASTLGRLRLTSLAWVAGSSIPLIAALVGIVLFYAAPGSSWLPELTNHYGAVPVGNFPRINSTFVSPSMFCNYLTATLMLTLISVRIGWLGQRTASAVVVAIGVAALFTVSIALGGLILAAGLWVWIDSSRKIFSRVALGTATAIGVAFLLMAPFALLPRSGESHFELWPISRFVPSSRFLVWSDSLATFLSDPITGKGVGTAVAGVKFQNYDGSWSMLTDAHNIFLSVAAQAGILGLASVVAIVIVVLRSALSKHEDGELSVIRTGLAVAFLCAFVYDGMTSSFEDARHLWVLIGLIVAAKYLEDEPGESVSSDSI